MYEFRVKNSRGDVLNISSSRDYQLYKITGLTPPKASVNMVANTTQDGSKINSVKLESRNIVIYLAVGGDIEKSRINLYKYFPPKGEVTLYFKNGKRNVQIKGVVELIECDLFSNKQIAQISVICPFPYFSELDNMVSEFSDVTGLFQFPFSIDETGVEFSAISTNIRKSIINVGDVPTGIVMELFATGEVVNPTIYEVDKRDFMRLNITMQASDKIIINTKVGEKSVSLVRAGVSSNALGYLSADSSWIMLEAGDNVFTYEAESGGSNLQIKITASTLYGGV